MAGDLWVDAAVIGGDFTGLTTAIARKRQEPSLEIVVLRADKAGPIGGLQRDAVGP